MRDHPLRELRFEIARFKSFGKNGSGQLSFLPINIVIGRNNVGKSSLIDAIEYALNGKLDRASYYSARYTSETEITATRELTKSLLLAQFPQGTFGGMFPGYRDYYEFAEERLLGKDVIFKVRNHVVSEMLSTLDLSDRNTSQQKAIRELVSKCLKWPPNNPTILRVAAERRVRHEKAEKEIELSPDGAGITNAVRAFINNSSLPRSVPEIDMLSDLNRIYDGDAEFTHIGVQENSDGSWEIHLREEKKGDIPLSESGSSLQTAFIILSLIHLTPHLPNQSLSNIVLCVEEPENNLHPSLLRRLLNYLADFGDRSNCTLVVTSHSPVCIDWSSRRQDSQVIHIRGKSTNAVCNVALRHGEMLRILEELDVRGSDLLQANGVIWVEGPSDRIYIRKWISLISNGDLIEGVHYSVVFYGGRVLSHHGAREPSDNSDVVNLISINRNCAVMIDSDRKQVRGQSARIPPRRLNDTKLRVLSEIERYRGYGWVTEGKEVENYVPKAVWKRAYDVDDDFWGPYDDLPNKLRSKTKVDIASTLIELMQPEDLDCMGLRKSLEELVAHIRRWNGSL